MFDPANLGGTPGSVMHDWRGWAEWIRRDELEAGHGVGGRDYRGPTGLKKAMCGSKMVCMVWCRSFPRSTISYKVVCVVWCGVLRTVCFCDDSRVAAMRCDLSCFLATRYILLKDRPGLLRDALVAGIQDTDDALPFPTLPRLDRPHEGTLAVE